MGQVIRLRNHIDEIVLGVMEEHGKELYEHWVRNYAGPHITKWLNEHDYDFDVINENAFVTHMVNQFIEWKNEHKGLEV
jgi:thiaminase